MTNKATYRIDAKVKRFSKLYALMKLNGNIDYDKLVRTWNINEKQPEWKCKRLLKSKTISDMVTEEIIKLYEKQGITTETVINEEKRILEDAKTGSNLRIQLDVVNNWRDSLDLKPQKQQQITTTETNYLELLKKDEQGTKQIKAKQTKTQPNNEETEQKQ